MSYQYAHIQNQVVVGVYPSDVIIDLPDFVKIIEGLNVVVGMRYENGQFTPPPPEPVTIPITDFYGLFGSQVSLLGQIQLSTIPAVVGLRTMLNSYQTLTKGHPVLNGGIDALVAVQLLTAEQAEKLKNFEPL